MSYIICVNRSVFQNFISKGTLKQYYLNKLNLSITDELYVQNQETKEIIGPFHILSESKPNYFVMAKENIVHIICSETITVTELPNDVLEQAKNDEPVVSIQYPSIGNDPFFTGFLWRVIDFRGRPKSMVVDLSNKPEYVREYAYLKMKEYDLEPEYMNDSLIKINNYGSIPVLLLCSNRICYHTQSDDFMKGYLFASSRIEESASVVCDIYLPGRYQCIFDFPDEFDAVKKYLTDRGLIISKTYQTHISLSPLCTSCDFLKLIIGYFKNNIKIDEETKNKEKNQKTINTCNFDATLLNRLLSEIILYDCELFGYFIANTTIINKTKLLSISNGEKIYRIIILPNSLIGDVLSENEFDSDTYLIFLNKGEIQYLLAKNDRGNNVVIETDLFINIPFDNFDRDYLILTNDYISNFITEYM